LRSHTLVFAAETQVVVTELAYDEAGSGRPPLLFLHGWCGDRSFFGSQFDCFARSHRVVSPDLSGHGKSPLPVTYAIEAFAGEVAELAQRLDLGPSVVFGHSIGAMVALAMARDFPELVGAVAMIDPPPPSKEVWKDFSGQLISSFEGSDGPAGRRQFVEQMFLPTDDPTRRAQIIETMTAVPNDIAIPLVRAIAAFDGLAALRECAVPVLTISSAVPTNDAASLLEASPTMTLGQTVGAGHFLMLEVPEQVNPMVERFLTVNEMT
jgi:pimeloyl-ACP methyl ester carboxylesterase